MKKWIITPLFILIVACGESKKEPVSVTFDTYNSYFLHNDVEPQNEPFYFASKNLDEFEKYFGAAATMSMPKQKWIDKNSIANKIIVAVANKTDNDTESVKITSVKKQGGTLLVNYEINKLNEPTTFTSRQCAIIVAAAREIKTVSFIESDKETKQIKVK